MQELQDIICIYGSVYLCKNNKRMLLLSVLCVHFLFGSAISAMCKRFEASFLYSGRVSYLCITRSFELIELFSFSVSLVHVFLLLCFIC